MGIFLWIVFGLIAGTIAKLIMPGRDPGGLLLTILLGVGGAMLGGMIGTANGYGNVVGFDVRSFGLAIAGALILLFAYRLITPRVAA